MSKPTGKKTPVVFPEKLANITSDQVKLSRFIHSLDGHSFKTVVAAVMSRLNDGED